MMLDTMLTSLGLSAPVWAGGGRRDSDSTPAVGSDEAPVGPLPPWWVMGDRGFHPGPSALLV